MKNQLEFLPDELLLYLFSMIPTFDLLKSMSHLNSRFDAVLRSTILTWNLGWPLLNELFIYLHQFSISMQANERFSFGILLQILEDRVTNLKKFYCSILMAKSITVMPDIMIVQE